MQSKNIWGVFGDDFSIGLRPGGDIGAFPLENHIYMQLLEGYHNVDLQFKHCHDNNVWQQYPWGIETGSGKWLEYNRKHPSRLHWYIFGRY